VTGDLSAVEPLGPDHVIPDDFDCTKPSISDWLKRHALDYQARGISRTYVVHRGGVVVGFYALAMSSIEHVHATKKIKRGLPGYPIPAVLLAQLGVDIKEQGGGLGGALLKDAILRGARLAEEIAARVILVNALDEDARSFYMHFNFDPSPTDPLHLMLRL
jgi:hypothetical protein